MAVQQLADLTLCFLLSHRPVVEMVDRLDLILQMAVQAVVVGVVLLRVELALLVKVIQVELVLQRQHLMEQQAVVEQVKQVFLILALHLQSLQVMVVMVLLTQ
jgi:hypothetical protein